MDQQHGGKEAAEVREQDEKEGEGVRQEVAEHLHVEQQQQQQQRQVVADDHDSSQPAVSRQATLEDFILNLDSSRSSTPSPLSSPLLSPPPSPPPPHPPHSPPASNAVDIAQQDMLLEMGFSQRLVEIVCRRYVNCLQTNYKYDT